MKLQIKLKLNSFIQDLQQFAFSEYKQMFQIPLSIQNLEQAIQTHTIFDDPEVIPHLRNILQLLNKKDNQDLDLTELSNVVKQTQTNTQKRILQNKQKSNFKQKVQQNEKKYNIQIRNFVKQAQKLQIAGICLGEIISQQINKQMIKLASQKLLSQARFWGKVTGTWGDYYVVQGYRAPLKQHVTLSIGSQKPGQGVNYYTYFVANYISNGNWEQLPQVSIQHIIVARMIKKLFTGNLNTPIHSCPHFPGVEKHYLKAQIVRITHSLQLTPRGVYKVNDQNPKVIEYEQQVRVPDFSQLSTLQGWTHRNEMILNLGRCSHFVDPSQAEDRIQAITSELAQKDPQIQRLRAITEDKPAQPVQGGLQSYWMQKTAGNNQTFPKDQNQHVYGVTTLRNVFWPGWVTIGYMNGYSNFYLGNGLKAGQPAWSRFHNDDLQGEAEQAVQFPQPNRKELPKPEQVEAQQNRQQGDD